MPDWQLRLKDEITPQLLSAEAGRMNDTEAARRMQKAKLALLAHGRNRIST